MLVTSEGYHTLISMNIRMNRMARWLEGNVGKFTGGGRLSVGGRVAGDQAVLTSVASV